MKKLLTILGLAVVMVMGCTPTVEPSADSTADDAQAAADASALTQVTATAPSSPAQLGAPPSAENDVATAYPPESAILPTIDPYPGQSGAPSSPDSAAIDPYPGESQAVAPGATVNLGELTPQPVDPNATPQVMPAPGRPGDVRVLPEVQVAIDEAVVELARELDVDPDAIELTGVGSMTWSDGSLGCPEDGMMYTQALVSGYLFIVEVDGKPYEIHTNGLSHYVVCDDGSPVTRGQFSTPAADPGGS
jgi:hypothetical protein